MLYTYNKPALNPSLVVEHVCFYWGDGNNWLVWESMPGGNAIRSKSTQGGAIVVLTTAG